MKTAVLVKQVPAENDGATDPEKGYVIRTGRTRMNPYDGPAVAAALAWRRAFGGTVEVFTMGPASARQVAAEALAMGADQGWLLTDPAFAGADTLATARTLALALTRAGDFDLVVCGQKTTDGDTGQVGPALAALLDRPFVGRVTDFSAEGIFRQQVDDEWQTVRTEGPTVISVVREAFPPVVPTLKMKMTKKPLLTLGPADLPGADPDLLGSRGSPTRIKKIYHPQRRTGRVLTVDGRQAAEIIFQEAGRL